MNLAKRDLSAVLAPLLFILLALSGCAQLADEVGSFSVERAVNKGRLSLFLNLLEPEGPDLSMQITSIQLRAEDGTIVSHDAESLNLESGKIKGGQKFLARIPLDPGNYTQIRFVIGEAGHVSEDGNLLIPLKEPERVIEFRSPLQMEVGDSKSLFFTWDTRQSLDENMFQPVITVAPILKKLIADVAYVACPEIDTVFMISTEQNRVIDSLGIPGGPTYLFQSNDPRSNEVYVLAGKAMRLYAFSTTNNRLTEDYNLSLVNKPVHMALSASGRWGYVLDRQLGTVFRMDLSSGTIDKQTRLNYDPVYIIFLERYDMLAVSLSVAQTIVLLHGDTLEEVRRISTGTSPEGLRLVDERLLYIAERGANSVMIYDMETDRMFKRMTVGFQPRRIVETNNYVYVATAGDSSISVLRHSGLSAARAVPFPGSPLEMAYADKNNLLYVGNRRDRSLEVIDSLTNEFKGKVELGAVPEGILVLR